jgi:hypothetical protein
MVQMYKGRLYCKQWVNYGDFSSDQKANQSLAAVSCFRPRRETTTTRAREADDVQTCPARAGQQRDDTDVEMSFFLD